MEDDRNCYCCGDKNEQGLRLRIEPDGDGVGAIAVMPSHLQGYRGVLHGGLTATLLDELMAHAARQAGADGAATARLQVTYRQPVPTGVPIRVVARVERRQGRRVEASAAIRSADGRLLAEGWGLLLAPR